MESQINIQTHQDIGTIRVELLQDRRANPSVAKAIYSGWAETIKRKVEDGVGDEFEEGPVFLQSSHRVHGGVELNRACTYRMHFKDQSTCARMHVHPHGERLLEINPVSEFRVYSLSPFDLCKNFESFGKQVEEELCKISKRVIFGIAVDSFVEFSVQIPRNTSHRFLGVACATSFHPDEISELKTIGAMASVMADQTSYWGSAMPTGNECQFG